MKYHELKKLQAMQMIIMKINGHTNKEIAANMNISVDTVERRLQFASKAGMFVDWERQLFESIVPSALTAVKTALEDGDAETALVVLQSVGVLKDPKAPKGDIEKLEDDSLQKAIAEARAERALVEGTINAEIIPGRKSLAGLLEETNATGPTSVDPLGGPSGVDGSTEAAATGSEGSPSNYSSGHE